MTDLRLEKIGSGVTLPRAKLMFKQDGKDAFEDLLELRDCKINQAPDRLEIYSMGYAEVVKIADRTKSTKVTGTLTCISPFLELLRFFCLADSVKDASQVASTLTATITARLGQWHDLGKYDLSDLIVKSNTGVTFTAEADDDKITKTSHGLTDGDIVRVINTGGALPAPLVIDTNYYVVSAEADTFKLAETLGGDAIDLSADGTGTNKYHRIYKENVDYEFLPEDGWLTALESGDIAEAEVLSVSGSYPDKSMQYLDGLSQVSKNGVVVILGANDDGIKLRFESYVSLNAEGDFGFISDAEQQFQLTFECLKSSLYPNLYRLIDISGKSSLRSAV